jgi:glycosyltransferase involved in cell wall biosynthesis
MGSSALPEQELKRETTSTVPGITHTNGAEAKFAHQSFTILIPLYNEAECLTKLVEQLNLFLAVSPVPTVVLFINDGSTDNSQQLIEAIAARDARYHYIKLHTNRGLSSALKAGIDHSKTTLIGYIDADLQTTPMDFLLLLDHIPQFDLSMGIRVNRNDGLVKRISSKVANAVRRLLVNDGIADTGCPLKIMKTEFAQAIPFFTGMHRFIPALIQLQGGKVKQIRVSHFPRYAGKAKYNLGNRLVKPFFDTLAFRWMKKRYIHYQIEKEA